MYQQQTQPQYQPLPPESQHPQDTSPISSYQSFLFDANSENDVHSMNSNDMDDSVWNFDEFIQFDIEDQNGMLQVPPSNSPPSNHIARRRSSSVNTPFTNPPLSISHSPVSSIEEASPPQHMDFFMDLDHLVIPNTNNNNPSQPPLQQSQQQQQSLMDQQDPSSLSDQPQPLPFISAPLNIQQQREFEEMVPKRRRRSSSVPPTFHSDHYKKHQVVFAPIQVAADSRPPPPHMLMKPSTPIQIQRLHRHRIPPTSPEQVRAAMDKRLQRMNFNDVTVAELKHMLRHYGHSTTGRKVELIERLQQEQQARQSFQKEDEENNHDENYLI